MLYKFINQTSPYYTEAVDLRIDLFYKDMENAIDLINDNDESTSLHLVCLNDEKVIGAARLTFKEDIGVISQVVVPRFQQHRGVGKGLIEMLINECKKQNMHKVILRARQTSIYFYKKFNFEGVGDIYPSKKTGILHQNMELILK